MKELSLEQSLNTAGGRCDATTWAGIWAGATAASILGGPGAFAAVGLISIIGNSVTGAICENPYWE